MASYNARSGRTPDQRLDTRIPPLRVVRADGFFGPERKGVVEALGVGQ